MVVIKEVQVGDKILRLETGKLGRQANGAILAQYGDTQVFVTAVAEETPKEDVDFFPLQVEYREKAFAAGKIPGGFVKREGKPTDKEILSGRLIDRPIRPLFPDWYKNETQIIAFVYSFDGQNEPDVIAACAASAALAISEIPFLEPIGEVRVGRIDGKFIINPTIEEIEKSDIELVVAGTESSIMMVEGEANEASEADMLEALRFAHEEIKKIVAIQKELVAECGKPKIQPPEPKIPAELIKDVGEFAREKMAEIVAMPLSKKERSDKNKEIINLTIEHFKEKYQESDAAIKEIIHDIEKDLMRKRILNEGIRLDGRKCDEIRPITIELGVLKRTHGSALFTRGETQSLTTLTLGAKNDEQIIDGLLMEYTKKFILHYNFPPFSVGEVGRISSPGRREIGHGNLAERSLKRMIPSEDEFPYTIRLNSDILESNGSSSMATVCAGSLALMDGGVPVKKAVAGIAMGLIKEGDKYAILSDILGNEDHLGDMDFKVAGTKDGITGFQMDIKIQGISFEIMAKALEQARIGRLKILEIMNEAISEPRSNISIYAPVVLRTKINPEQIGMVIGPGGKVIQGIQKEFGVEIFIEEDGTVNIYSSNRDNAVRCRDYIRLMTSDPIVGEVYQGRIVKITDFGAFVEIAPGKEGLLHISQIDKQRVNKVEDFFKEGDIVTVKLMKFENGKMTFSRKALLDQENKNKSL
jgi:polyribonucleotide nucleotidyltransferase